MRCQPEGRQTVHGGVGRCYAWRKLRQSNMHDAMAAARTNRRRQRSVSLGWRRNHRDCGRRPAACCLRQPRACSLCLRRGPLASPTTISRTLPDPGFSRVCTVGDHLGRVGRGQDGDGQDPAQVSGCCLVVGRRRPARACAADQSDHGELRQRTHGRALASSSRCSSQ